MNCPTCGKAGYVAGIKGGEPDSDDLNNMVKHATAGGNKLKNMRPSRTRPDAIGKSGGMTRGGRYARD